VPHRRRHEAFDPIRRHLDDPSCSHLRSLITSVVSVFEDMQNEQLSILEDYMTQMTDKLLGAVALLASNVAAHDTALQSAVERLKTTIATAPAPDDPSIGTAIDAISAASTKIAGETQALIDAMPPAVAQAAAAAVQDPAPAQTAALAPVTDGSDTSANVQ
jgi:recombination DNA repair RAD52 pathway protein